VLFPKRLRYEKQIKALHLFRLLSLEMLHRRVEIEKEDYRKKSTFSRWACQSFLQGGSQQTSPLARTSLGQPRFRKVRMLSLLLDKDWGDYLRIWLATGIRKTIISL
jgi:hypothetical protein